MRFIVILSPTDEWGTKTEYTIQWLEDLVDDSLRKAKASFNLTAG